MTSVFIGGSRRLARMNAALAHRLDNIVSKHLHVLIGDANGFDRAAQAYLAERRYSNVTVYCTLGICRNNVGKWPLHTVPYEGADRGRDFYTAKDDAMIRDSNYGLFAWDGRSKGTLRNVQLMAERRKPSALYVSPRGVFATIRDPHDLTELVHESSNNVTATEELFSDEWQSVA